MVITFRLPSIDDAAEMMRIQKRKKQGAGGSSAAAMATTARIESAPSPLRPPPPLHRLHNTTATVDNVVAGVGTGTPPLAISPGQTCRRPGKNNRERAQAKDHPRQHYIQHKHAPIISWGGKLAQPAASAVDLAAASATTSGGGGSQITRGVDEDEPLPWPPTLSSLHLQPRPLHSHSPQIHLPNPSFGEEDFGILAGCIENLDSMGSVDDSSVVFIDSIRQGETSGGTSFHATATADDRHYSSCMSLETENVMAAARTAATAVLEGSSTDYGTTHAFADTSQSRSIPASALSEKDALPTQSLDKGADVITTMETKMTPPSVPTTDDFMRRSHSSESVVVTSPSRNGDSNCSRSTVSHPPSSPEPFLLLTPAGMPGASPPTHQHLHMYETSPTSLHWDEEYATMEQFFKDVTGEGPTSTCTTSHPNAGEVVVGQDNLGEMSSGKEGLNNALPDGACGDVGGGNFVQFSPVKSKCDVLYDCRSPLLVEGGMGGMEQKHIRTQQQYHQAHEEDNRHLASNIASPISLGIVMTSLSTSSVECIDAADIKVQTSKKSKKENKKKLKKNKNRNSPVKSTILLTPQNQLYSPPRSSPSVPLPSQPQLNQENETGIDSIEVDRFNDLMHPSKATLEQYDNELYHKLKSMHPPQCMIMPQSLVPSTMTGNRLVILQGSSKRIKHYETEECVLHSTHALYQFLSEIYPALEDCTYLLPGLQQRRSNSQCSNRCEEEAGIDLRSKIHVSSLGNFALGHLPGLPRSDKV